MTSHIDMNLFIPNLSPLKTHNSRKKFTAEEDELLKKLVEKFGCKKWESIALEMPGRTGRQCRDRYKNYLVPGYFNGQWTQEEDDLLKQKYSEIGPQWSKMTKFIAGRSANSLKNRWNYFVSRQMPVIPENQIYKSRSLPNVILKRDKTDSVLCLSSSDPLDCSGELNYSDEVSDMSIYEYPTDDFIYSDYNGIDIFGI